MKHDCEMQQSTVSEFQSDLTPNTFYAMLLISRIIYFIL